MSRIFIAPYKMGSASAKALASTLNCKRVDGSKIFKHNDVIINWGNNGVSHVRGNAIVLNKASCTRIAANKLESLLTFKLAGVSTLEFTSNIDQAKIWLRSGKALYARTKLSGHSGDGIVYLSRDNGLWVDAELYTVAFPTDKEYRVHVFNGKVIDIQQKKRREGSEVNRYIRNVSNGWVFAREEVRAPYKVYTESLLAVNAIGLDFGACDVLVDKDNNVVVCEVNTSPGLEGTTLNRYKEAIERIAYETNSYY